MNKIEIIQNDKLLRTVNSEEETVENILKSSNVDFTKTIAVKVNNEYVALDKNLDQDTKLELVNIDSIDGYRIYKDTSIFILCYAFHKIFPKDELVIEHSIGDGVYVEIINYNFTEEEVKRLKEEFENIVKSARPIIKHELEAQEAYKIARRFNRKDILKNIQYETMSFFQCEEYYDYFVNQLAFNTSQMKPIQIQYHAPGLILRFAQKDTNVIDDKRQFPRKLFSTHQEHDKWLNILKLHNVSALNKAIKNYHIKNLIQIEEALHEKKIVNIAKEITQEDKIKLILVAGPSSSGKTTFAKRLSIQLQVNGVLPKIISMDDYFLPRKKTPKKINGDYDYENIEALDLELLNSDLKALMSGKEIKIPKYNFISGKREKSYRKFRLGENEIIIMEGIHGLNDKLTPSIPFNQKIKIYVSALNNLNIDSHNRIMTTDSRKFRRMVRDYKFRGHQPEYTLGMWDSVREGEDKYIFPYQENADFMLNSSLTYELGVLKKFLMPLLKSITNFSETYTEAQRLMRILDHIYNIQNELIPSNSILREFVGGSIFEY